MKYGVLVALVVACASTEPMPSRTDHLGPLTFDVPADWTRVDSVNGGMRTSVWTPSSNERKESISVVRIERAALKVKGTTLEALVESAQGSLQGARIAKIAKVTSSRGLTGVRASVSFTPRLQTTTYHRTQATLIDGDALIHIFYTAVDPDDTVEPFTMVLDSIRHEEG